MLWGRVEMVRRTLPLFEGGGGRGFCLDCVETWFESLEDLQGSVKDRQTLRRFVSTLFFLLLFLLFQKVNRQETSRPATKTQKGYRKSRKPERKLLKTSSLLT